MKIQPLLTLISFQTCMIFFASNNTKGNVRQNVHAVLCHTLKVNGDQEISRQIALSEEQTKIYVIVY